MISQKFRCDPIINKQNIKEIILWVIDSKQISKVCNRKSALYRTNLWNHFSQAGKGVFQSRAHLLWFRQNILDILSKI